MQEKSQKAANNKMDLQQEKEVPKNIPITLLTNNVAGGTIDTIGSINNTTATIPPLHENKNVVTENTGAVDGTATQLPKKKKKKSKVW